MQRQEIRHWIITLDRLSHHFLDPLDDSIRTHADAKCCQLWDSAQALASSATSEGPELGGTVDWLFSLLASMSQGPPTLFRLVLGGHGLDPEDAELLEDGLFSHPCFKSVDDGNWTEGYQGNSKADLHKTLLQFYKTCGEALNTPPSGIVGGELHLFQRGFLGILGVLGMWYHATSQTTHHKLEIAVDCCFAGSWTIKLRDILTSHAKQLADIQTVIKSNPVCVTAACAANEASVGGWFVPWYIQPHITNWPDCSQRLVGQCPLQLVTHIASEQPQNLHGSPLHDLCATDSCRQALTAHRHFSLEFANQQVQHWESVIKNLTCRPHIRPDPSHLEKASQNLCQAKKALSLQQTPDHYHLRSSLFEDKMKLHKLFVAAAPADIQAGVYALQGGTGDMTLIVAPRQQYVMLIDGGKSRNTFEAAWKSHLSKLTRITHIFVTHHDTDHTSGIRLLLGRLKMKQQGERLPSIKGCKLYMNVRKTILATKGYQHEEDIANLATKLNIKVLPAIVPRDQDAINVINGQRLKLDIVAPRHDLVMDRAAPGKYVRDTFSAVGYKSTDRIYCYGSTTGANVLSINLVLLWEKRDAFLFSGDSHLTTVSDVAREFLKRKKLKMFAYADVPHHGSIHSNRTSVDSRNAAFKRLSAKCYVLSSKGNTQNPHPKVVLDLVTAACGHNPPSVVIPLYDTRDKQRRCPKCNKRSKAWTCGCWGAIADRVKRKSDDHWHFVPFTARKTSNSGGSGTKRGSGGKKTGSRKNAGR